MFDLNNDRVLTFEEFTFATSAQNYDDPKEKLYWLFDNVYDKVRIFLRPYPIQLDQISLNSFFKHCKTLKNSFCFRIAREK